jgi:hypothetical protein
MEGQYLLERNALSPRGRERMKARSTKEDKEPLIFFVSVRAIAILLLSLLALPHAPLIASAQTTQANAGMPDFSGYWMRPEAGSGRMFYPPETGPGPLINIDETRAFTIGDHLSPILLPPAAEAVQAHGDQGRAGEVIYPAWSLCWPPGVPLILNMAEPVQFLQREGQVTIIYQRGMQIRKIYLNDEHPDEITPSWYGHSIGHYEGSDTLVIDTIAQDTRALTDRFGSPKSEAMRVVERYTISADRQSLNVEFEVEDPNMFTSPWFSHLTYVHPSSRPGYEPGGINRDDEAIQEAACAENNRDAAGGLFPIPMANRVDF